jgi:Short C-terminal domain
MFRRRPLLRAAAVGGGAYLAGKKTAQHRADQEYQDSEQDQRISALEQQQGTAPPPARDQAGGSPLGDQLNQLADLHRQGVLSDDEFASAKAKLLGN